LDQFYFSRNGLTDAGQCFFMEYSSRAHRVPGLWCIASEMFGGATIERVTRTSAMRMRDYGRRDMSITCLVLIASFTTAADLHAATLEVDCNAGGIVAPALDSMKPGDTLLIRGICRENIVIQPEVQRITIDGQGKATVHATDARQPAIQVLGREITIKGLTLTEGLFGVAVNRGASAVIDHNAIRNAKHSGIEVSQNSFGRIINNTIEENRLNGILVLGSASVHIGVLSTGDTVPSPNVMQKNGEDGISVMRASTARIIGNTFSGNGRNGLTIQQASQAEVAGNLFNGNRQHGIWVAGNSVLNLADSVTRLFERPNTTTAPNGSFGILCETGAYVDGSIGSVRGSRGTKDALDKSCIDRSAR
jgi:parallel beta-helix repeat protein